MAVWVGATTLLAVAALPAGGMAPSAPAAAAVAATPSPRAAIPAPRPEFASDGRPILYLTFDDGPSPTWTPRVLRVLREQGATATFFVVGQRAARHEQLARRVVAEGHTLGSHTWNHPHLSRLSDTEVTGQLLVTQAQVAWLGGGSGCYRPPYGDTSDRVRELGAALGQREYLWTVSTKDWSHPGLDTLLANARAGMVPGGIISFHDGDSSGSADTIAAVRTLLAEARARGFTTAGLPC